MMASAFITISISSTRNWAYVTCACRHGYPAGCRSTSTATTGWPVSCVSRVSNIGSSTTPLSKSRTGRAPSGSPMDGQPNVSTESWTSSRAGTVRFIAISRLDITGAPTSASTPPISFSANRRTCRLSTRTWRAPLFTPSSPDNIATFLGRKLSTRFEGEMGNRFNIRIEGMRIKHTMGPVSIKLYDKFSLILRIETTVNDLSFFKHYRQVEHRDGSRETKWACMQKTIYSLPALRELLEAANRRYLEFLSAVEDPR